MQLTRFRYVLPLGTAASEAWLPPLRRDCLAATAVNWRLVNFACLTRCRIRSFSSVMAVDTPNSLVEELEQRVSVRAAHVCF